MLRVVVRGLALATFAVILAPARRACAQYPDTIRPPAVLADTGDAVLWGVVRDEATGHPVAWLVVRVESANAGAVTDSLGRYVIHHMERTGRMWWFTVRTGSGAGPRWFAEQREMRMFWPDEGIVVATTDGKPGAPLRRSFTNRLDFWVRRFRIPF